MLPPSDSISHSNLKLAEFVAGLSTQDSRPPPPPYAPRQHAPSAYPSEELLGQVDDIDDDDDICCPTPIAIKIDSSIHVDGHANTVTIPSSLSSPGQGATTPQQLQLPQLQRQRSPTAETAPPTTPASPTPKQLQLQRQAKSAQLVTSIVDGLRSSGALEDAETGRQRPVEISVNAGIHIKGNNNVICAAGARRQEQSPAPSRPPSSSLARKRRAVSEPAEESAYKRAAQ